MNRFVAPFLLISLASASPLLGADSAAGEAAARDYNKAGIEAFKKGDFEGAMGQFERAFDLFPEPKVRLNLGVTEEKLGHLDEARVHYEAFLRDYPKDAKSAVVKKKLAAIQKKMKDLGKVILVVEPPADRITLAGQVFTRMPVKAWIEPGLQPVLIEKAGYLPHQQELPVQSGQRFELKVALEKGPEAPPPEPAVTGNFSANNPFAEVLPSLAGGQVAAGKPVEGKAAPEAAAPKAFSAKAAVAPVEDSVGGWEVMLWGFRGTGVLICGAAALVVLAGLVSAVILVGLQVIPRMATLPGYDKNKDIANVLAWTTIVIMGLSILSTPTLAAVGAAAIALSHVL